MLTGLRPQRSQRIAGALPAQGRRSGKARGRMSGARPNVARRRARKRLEQTARREPREHQAISGSILRPVQSTGVVRAFWHEETTGSRRDGKSCVIVLSIRANSDTKRLMRMLGLLSGCFMVVGNKGMRCARLPTVERARRWTKSWTCHFSLYSLRYRGHKKGPAVQAQRLTGRVRRAGASRSMSAPKGPQTSSMEPSSWCGRGARLGRAGGNGEICQPIDR